MAIVSLLGQPLRYPRIEESMAGSMVIDDTGVINSTSDRIALMARAPYAMTISTIAFRTGVVTAAETISARIEQVDAATGLPSGPLWATDTSGTQTTPASYTTYEVTLTASASVNAGDVFAVVLQCDSGSPNLIIARWMTAIHGMQPVALPYAASNLTGSYAKSGSNIPIVGVYDSGTSTWAPLGNVARLASSPAATTAIVKSYTFNTGTRYGLRFRLPFGASLIGGAFRIASTTYGDWSLILYADDGTSIATLSTVDKDWWTNANGWSDFLAASAQTLAANTYYRLMVVPTTSTTVSMYAYTVPTGKEAYWNTWEGGADFHLSSYAASTWGQATIERPMMSLLLNGIDTGSAGGGLLRHPGMGGGLNG